MTKDKADKLSPMSAKGVPLYALTNAAVETVKTVREKTNLISDHLSSLTIIVARLNFKAQRS